MATHDLSATLPTGTTHYHAVKATELWSEFAAAMVDKARRTAAEREDRERERVKRTTYYRAEQSPTAGG